VTNYVAAILIVAAVALFVAAPLSGGFPRRRGATIRELELERLEHDRGHGGAGLARTGIRSRNGQAGRDDYRDLKRSLEDRALAAMSAIERVRGASALRRCGSLHGNPRSKPGSGSGGPERADRDALCAAIIRRRKWVEADGEFLPAMWRGRRARATIFARLRRKSERRRRAYCVAAE